MLLCLNMGGIYPARCAVQEPEMRLPKPQVEFILGHTDLSGQSVEDMARVFTYGATAKYEGGPPAPPRTRGLPYQIGDWGNTFIILSKLWKDLVMRRLFFCATVSITLSHPVEATPTITSPKKNPDRSVSSDRREIADLRRANLSFDTNQYYKVVVPSVYDLTRWIMSLAGMYPGLPHEGG